MPVHESMSRGRFLQEYKLGFKKEFEIDGHAAQWAPGTSGPRFWGDEDDRLELPHEDDPSKSNVETAALAASPDFKYLAASSNAVIRVFDMTSKKQKAELVGHPNNVYSLRFAPSESESAKYVLLSESAPVGGADGDIIVWHLDGEGKMLHQTTPFAIGHLTDLATAAIVNELKDDHHVSDDGVAAVHTGFADVLKKVDTENRVSGLPRLKGHFTSFGSDFISHDGKKMIYEIHGASTQSGMRPPDQLPQIVVYDLINLKEICRLKGHTDAIMWAAFSPDAKTVATACWDETYKLWDASTGKCRATIGPTNGQNWSGAFSPDGKHVVLSGGSPTTVAIYATSTGEEIARFSLPGGGTIRRWVRNISWSPSGKQIALVVEQSLILWQPFEQTQQEILSLKNDGSMLDRFCSLGGIQWIEEGKRLVVCTSEGSVMVWEAERNVKWRFQRPEGFALDVGDGDVVVDVAKQRLWALNGDWVVRAWDLQE